MNGNNAGAESESDYTKLVPIIWTALRLLGVYIVIVGISAIIEDFATMIARWQLDTAGYHSGIFIDYISPSFIGDVFYVAGGLYLLFGGKWLIENVFLPARATDSDIENDKANSA